MIALRRRLLQQLERQGVNMNKASAPAALPLWLPSPDLLCHERLARMIQCLDCDSAEQVRQRNFKATRHVGLSRTPVGDLVEKRTRERVQSAQLRSLYDDRSVRYDPKTSGVGPPASGVRSEPRIQRSTFRACIRRSEQSSTHSSRRLGVNGFDSSKSACRGRCRRLSRSPMRWHEPPN